MSLSLERKQYLESMCKKFRIDLIELLHSIQTGHPGGSLSAAEIVTTLYFEKMIQRILMPRKETGLFLAKVMRLQYFILI
ncbi:MAG: transketolase [Clostridiales bacterium]|nr:transketolase [Clostridiales bacterium]